MTTKEAITHFGNIKTLADLLKVWPQTIYNWGTYPPRSRQFELHYLSKGVLPVEKW